MVHVKHISILTRECDGPIDGLTDILIANAALYRVALSRVLQATAKQYNRVK